VIGSNRVTWCKLVWGIDRVTDLTWLEHDQVAHSVTICIFIAVFNTKYHKCIIFRQQTVQRLAAAVLLQILPSSTQILYRMWIYFTKYQILARSIQILDIPEINEHKLKHTELLFQNTVYRRVVCCNIIHYRRFLPGQKVAIYADSVTAANYTWLATLPAISDPLCQTPCLRTVCPQHGLCRIDNVRATLQSLQRCERRRLPACMEI